MKTIFLATVPPPPARDKYDFASLRDYGMQVAASVRDQYQGRIAELEAENAALKALVKTATEWVEYSNLDDSVGRRCCCGVIAYRDHETWCKFAAAIDAVVTADGAFVGIWRERESAERVIARSPMAKGERIRPMIFDDLPDPLGDALNSGDGSYRP